MHHVAIMNKSWKLIPKIISGEKKIESRWYQTKRTPWNKIAPGDKVYFKNSGELVTAQADVWKVKQFEIHSLADAQNIVSKFGKDICLVEDDPARWGKLPRYCVLVHLKNPIEIKKPFQINKTGFGAGAAWLTVRNIKYIRVE